MITRSGPASHARVSPSQPSERADRQLGGTIGPACVTSPLETRSVRSASTAQRQHTTCGSWRPVAPRVAGGDEDPSSDGSRITGGRGRRRLELQSSEPASRRSCHRQHDQRTACRQRSGRQRAGTVMPADAASELHPVDWIDLRMKRVRSGGPEELRGCHLPLRELPNPRWDRGTSCRPSSRRAPLDQLPFPNPDRSTDRSWEACLSAGQFPMPVFHQTFRQHHRFRNRLSLRDPYLGSGFGLAEHRTSHPEPVHALEMCVPVHRPALARSYRVRIVGFRFRSSGRRLASTSLLALCQHTLRRRHRTRNR